MLEVTLPAHGRTVRVLFEEGVIENYDNRYTTTEIGRSCIMNGITEIDIFTNEITMQQISENYINNCFIINDTNILLNVINEIFIQFVENNRYANFKNEAEKIRKENKRSKRSKIKRNRTNI